MKKYKTENLSIQMTVDNSATANDKKSICVAMTDCDAPLDEPQYEINLPAPLCKSQFNDANFVKHILNFFIKE